jgi:HEAT repeat protein
VQESEEQASDISANQDINTDSDTIRLLIAKLTGEDGLERDRARWSLVAIGNPAVAPLIELLEARNKQVRWEAAKALADIRDPMAASALVKALEDNQFDIRWIAAEGLINLGREGLVPLLQALIERSDSPWLREGAHHVLHELAEGDLKELLQPIVDSLEGIESAVESPIRAQAALDALGGEQAQPDD